MAETAVTGVRAYPIKSCGGIVLQQAVMSPLGIKHDREWMVTRRNGSFITQRTHPRLALVQTALTDETLEVIAPRHGTLSIPLDRQATANGREIAVEVFKKSGTAIDQGQAAGEFFSDYLGIGAMLLRVSRPRLIKPECRIEGYSEQTGFADGFPLLLASEASRRQLETAADRPIAMDRFRPNIIVDGGDLPAYDEDHWREIRLGCVSAAVVRACARCPMPNIGQNEGVLPRPDGRFVSTALSAARSGIDPLSGKPEVFFGQNLAHKYIADSVIRVGDPVEVLARSPSPNFEPLGH